MMPMVNPMALPDALDIVYGRRNWDNPFYEDGLSISSMKQTPYDAYMDLPKDKQGIVIRLIGHKPTREEGIE
jgi:hypothetical protein